MIAIILSALWGVVMMFSGIFFKRKSAAGVIAVLGITALVIISLLEYCSYLYLPLDVKGMLTFSSFSQVFNMVAFICTLIYFLLNASEFEEAGNDVYEYYALIFFILCGI